MNKTIEERIKKEFSCSGEHWFLGGYLLADGTNVDVRGECGQDHRIIAGCFNKTTERYHSGTGWYGVVGMLKRGHMRTSPESNGFEFMKKPTLAQFRAIRDFVLANDCAEDCYFERFRSQGDNHYIGNYYDFVSYLKKKYGEYTYS